MKRLRRVGLFGWFVLCGRCRKCALCRLPGRSSNYEVERCRRRYSQQRIAGMFVLCWVGLPQMVGQDLAWQGGAAGSR